ncbi:MAG: hypothetical protein DRI79_12405, partial [Chloroflexi bacterium]
TGTGGAVITITKNITLYGGWDGSPYRPVVRDPDRNRTILDGEGQRRVILILKTTSISLAPTIDGFIIANGNASNALFHTTKCGGGIYSRDASPIITNNVITNNVAYTGTSVAGSGGGICAEFSNGGAVIAHNQVISNVASWATNGSGGGIYLRWVTGTRVIENVVVSNMAAMSATGHGGGIYVGGCKGAVLQGNRVEHNVASANGQGSGGGLYVLSPISFTMTNNIVAANHAFGKGGGLYLQATGGNRITGTLVHNTLAVNDRGSGTNGRTALYVEGSNTTLVLTNNLVYHHTYGIYVGSGSTTTLHNTLFYANSTDNTGGSGTITNTAPITGKDPLLDADYHLRPGSPAVDAGAPLPWLTADIDGDPRPLGGGYDIGADEVYLRVLLPLVMREFP